MFSVPCPSVKPSSFSTSLTTSLCLELKRIKFYNLQKKKKKRFSDLYSPRYSFQNLCTRIFVKILYMYCMRCNFEKKNPIFYKSRAWFVPGLDSTSHIFLRFRDFRVRTRLLTCLLLVMSDVNRELENSRCSTRARWDDRRQCTTRTR